MDEQIQLNSIIGDSNILDIDVQSNTSSYIKVVGVGGAGTNAVNHMFAKGIKGVDLFVCNTDATNLNASPVANKISIGKLGAGNDPQRGQKAAEENADRISGIFDSNTRMLFVTAGMGGGTGTGASPVVAKLAKQIDLPEEGEKILVVGVVTLPFSFEGRKRRTQAEEGIKKLKEIVDCIIIVNTDKLRERGKMSFKEAFSLADDVLFTAVKGISEIMTNTGYVQVDFRDVQSVMKDSGVALMGLGIAEGENRALEAIKAATASDLLNDNDISQTKDVLLTISCSEKDFTMEELEVITDYLEEQTNKDINTIWGVTFDESLGNKLSITLIATGFEAKQEMYTPERRTPGGTIPTPEEASKKTETIVVQPENKQEPLSHAGADDMTIKVVADDKPISREQPKQVEPDKPEKRTIVLDENMNPVDTSAKSTTGFTPITSVSIHQEPSMVNAIAEEETSQTTITVETPAKTGELADIVNQTTWPSQPATKGTMEEERVARIKRIRDMMTTPDGLESIINSHPSMENDYNISQNFSSPRPKSSLGIDSSGDLSFRNNSAIDAQVD